jgi:hypothetical protein
MFNLHFFNKSNGKKACYSNGGNGHGTANAGPATTRERER